GGVSVVGDRKAEVLVDSRGLGEGDHEAATAVGGPGWTCPVDSHLRGGEAPQVQGELSGRPTDNHVQDRSASQVVASDLVLQGQVVVLDVVGRVTVLCEEVVDARGGGRHRSSSSTHGPIGLPIQRVPSGIASPLITSDTGPTVAWRPTTAAGRMTLLGPRVAPSR